MGRVAQGLSPCVGSWRSQAQKHGLERVETQGLEAPENAVNPGFLGNCWLPHILYTSMLKGGPIVTTCVLMGKLRSHIKNELNSWQQRRCRPELSLVLAPTA